MGTWDLLVEPDAEPTEGEKLHRQSTEELRVEATASKDAHSLEVNSMGAVDIAKYLTHNVEDDMIDPKRMAEVKRYARKNPALLKAFKVAMSVLAETTEIDEAPKVRDNIIDGLAL